MRESYIYLSYWFYSIYAAALLDDDDLKNWILCILIRHEIWKYFHYFSFFALHITILTYSYSHNKTLSSMFSNMQNRNFLNVERKMFLSVFKTCAKISFKVNVRRDWDWSIYTRVVVLKILLSTFPSKVFPFSLL